MRKVAVYLVSAVFLVSISKLETAHAQDDSLSLSVGGGLGIPIDAEGISNGPAIRIGAALPVYQNLSAVVEGHYSKNGAEDDLLVPGLEADVKLTGGHIGIMLRSPSSSVSVYGQGGIGITRAEGKASVSFLGESISASTTETVFSFTMGGGIQIPITPSISVTLDARYNQAATEVEATKWMPITVSVVFTP